MPGVRLTNARVRPPLVPQPYMATPVSQSRPPLALIVNDQEWWARSLESILAAKGYAVLRAYTGAEGLTTARSARPDLILVEMQLPDMEGVEVCGELHGDPSVGASVPLVLTASGAATRERRLAAYQCGAWEFVSEPLDADLLMLRLGNLLKARQEVERLRGESLLDDVTGLYNLRGLARRLREMGAEAQRRHESLACIAVAPDVEGGSSDTAVRVTSLRTAEQLGTLLRQAVRTSDAVGRLGQSEFAIVSVGTRQAGIVRLARRMQQLVDDAQLKSEQTSTILRVSAGYCAVDDFSASAVDPAEVLVRATTALREARTSRTSGEIRAYHEMAPPPRASLDSTRSANL